MKRLIYNAVYCNLCDATIQSYHTHDFKYCSCGNAMVDGGLEYARWGWNKEDTVINYSLCLEDHPFSIIRQYYYRWNHHKDQYVLLMNIDDEWLDSIVSYYLPGPNQRGKMPYEYLLLFIEEKLYRAEKEY
jgi:hypothetical protein